MNRTLIANLANIAFLIWISQAFTRSAFQVYHDGRLVFAILQMAVVTTSVLSLTGLFTKKEWGRKFTIVNNFCLGLITTMPLITIYIYSIKESFSFQEVANGSVYCSFTIGLLFFLLSINLMTEKSKTYFKNYLA